MSGPGSAFYRALVATVVLVPFRLVRGGKVPLTRHVTLLAVLAGVFFAFDLAFFNTAVMRTSAATSTLLGNNAPVLVGLGSWFIFRKRPRPVFWMGLALALVGSATIVGGDAFRHTTLGAGDAMAIAASVFFAGYLLTVERARANIDTLTLTTVAVAASAATLLLLCLVLREPLSGFTLHAWLALIGLGLVSQIGGYLSVTYALGHLPATVTSVGLLAQAPLTALLAIPFLGESLVLTQVIGGALVIVGIYVVNRRSIPVT